MLQVKNFTVSIGDKQILDNLNFTFEKGKVYAIMGPNGSGKSTLAASIMGHPLYTQSEKSSLKFNNIDVRDEEAFQRAKRGIFLSFQRSRAL